MKCDIESTIVNSPYYLPSNSERSAVNSDDAASSSTPSSAAATTTLNGTLPSNGNVANISRSQSDKQAQDTPKVLSRNKVITHRPDWNDDVSSTRVRKWSPPLIRLPVVEVDVTALYGAYEYVRSTLSSWGLRWPRNKRFLLSSKKVSLSTADLTKLRDNEINNQVLEYIKKHKLYFYSPKAVFRRQMTRLALVVVTTTGLTVGTVFKDQIRDLAAEAVVVARRLLNICLGRISV